MANAGSAPSARREPAHRRHRTCLSWRGLFANVGSAYRCVRCSLGAPAAHIGEPDRTKIDVQSSPAYLVNSTRLANQ